MRTTGRWPFDTAPRITHLFGEPVALNGLIDEIPIGVLVLDLDRRVIWLNQSLSALIGFTREQAVGISGCYILRSNVCIQNCPALQLDASSGPRCAEGNLISKDRQLIPIRITCSPVKNPNGQCVGFMETVEDLRPLHHVKETASQAYSYKHIIGRSPEMEKIFRILPSIAQSDSSVLITGETGTGKDMVAETIHRASNRAKGPFVKINCGALPETLLESELFGHRKGAFTGAVENKPGRFHLAHNGTLYLTEIGDLPLALQVKLLTFLDDRVVFPLGSTKGALANVRIIAATHRNLEQMVREDRFRRDLLYRLNVVRLHLPPLRNRQGDVRLLLDHFLNTLAAQMGGQVNGFTDAALRVLMAYQYPGNVRELRNMVEYAVNVCRGRKIESAHLPAYLTASASSDKIPDAALPETLPEQTTDNTGRPRHQDLGQNWPEIEKQMILDALIRAGGRKYRAAEALGWARSTLWRKMKQHGITGS